MKICALFMLLLSVLLTACNTHKKTTPPPLVIEERPQPAPSPSYEADTAPIAKTEPEIENETKSVENDIDLLQRMRQGFDFPTLQSTYVNQYEKWFSNHPTYLHNLFARGEPFIFYLLEEIEKRGLPTELVLLPAVESSFKPDAISQSGAAGLWQFMPATGRGFDLHRTYWFDDRKDFIASTKAGLDYLTQLNAMFDGDWFLTLAAYNAGPGTVKRAIKKNQSKGKPWDYKSLKLRDETRRYIPKLQALKNIINNPESKLTHLANRPSFNIYTIDSPINLETLAKRTNIPPKKLKHLNAGFLRWPNSGPGKYRLLVPQNVNSSLFNHTLNTMRNSNHNIAYYTVKKNDTLIKIAKKSHSSVAQLKKINQLNSAFIKVGQVLKIPSTHSPPSTHTVTHEGGRRKLIHHVQKGDTLWSIARRYQVKVSDISAWNKLNVSSILNLNQKLFIYAQ